MFLEFKLIFLNVLILQIIYEELIFFSLKLQNLNCQIKYLKLFYEKDHKHHQKLLGFLILINYINNSFNLFFNKLIIKIHVSNTENNSNKKYTMSEICNLSFITVKKKLLN